MPEDQAAVKEIITILSAFDDEDRTRLVKTVVAFFGIELNSYNQMSKTKEHIFDEIVGEHHRTLSPANYSNVVKAMDEYAKNKAIDFAEWMDDKMYNNILAKVRSRVSSYYGKWSYAPVGKETKYLSTEELYTIFLQSQSQ